MAAIRRVHDVSKGVYGGPRVDAELVAEGLCVGRHKVAHLMRLERLRGCPKRRFRVTTQREPAHPVARNLLQQDFTAEAPNQRWAADITYISTAQGWLYLAVVMDLYSQRIVGWSMSRWMSRHLVVDALRMALAARRPEGPLKADIKNWMSAFLRRMSVQLSTADVIEGSDFRPILTHRRSSSSLGYARSA